MIETDIELGALVISRPYEQIVKFLYVDERNNLAVKEGCGTNIFLLSFVASNIDELNELIRKTAIDFNVKKIIYRTGPEKISEKICEALCYMIVEGETNE